VGVDITVPTDETVRTDHDDTATVRPQAGNNALGGGAMRARKRRTNTGSDYLSDALALLSGWTRDGVQLRRDLACDDSQHAALTERIKVAADTLSIRPRIRRVDGHTEICLGERDGEAITDGEVTLAARIEDFYRTVLEHP
jgi:4a-hydroxytetrahydrobiopterin dehydratase